MTDNDHGADLRERFDRAMSDLPAPDRLTATVLTDGHRLRRRRRLLAAGGSVAAVAVVTTLAVATLGGGTPSSGPQVATEPPAQQNAETPSPGPIGSGLPSPGPDEWPSDPFPDDPAGWWSMPASTMADELAALLPEGMELTDAETTNTDRAPGEPKHELKGYVTAVLHPADDGPGKVNMKLYPPDSGEPAPPPETDADGNVTMFAQEPTATERTTCDPDWINEPVDCTVLSDDFGNPIGRVLDSTAGGVRALSLDLLTADGGVVMISVANTLADKWPTGTTPSAEEVPLDLATLRAIAADPVWTSYVP